SVLIYVIIGGFRAVALTDTIQGIVMFVGTLVLLIAVIVAGGGVNQIISDLYVENPNLITPFGDDGSLSAAYVSSFWILVVVGVVALLQVFIRCMSCRNAKVMHCVLLIYKIV